MHFAFAALRDSMQVYAVLPLLLHKIWLGLHLPRARDGLLWRVYGRNRSMKLQLWSDIECTSRIIRFLKSWRRHRRWDFVLETLRALVASSSTPAFFPSPFFAVKQNAISFNGMFCCFCLRACNYRNNGHEVKFASTSEHTKAHWDCFRYLLECWGQHKIN